ncbi:hypothetical protein PHLCEN_2v7753 [Hermanssonia centrifuga]|uniref:Uncharacterized protein n=1 Tax=Hermanssonia centrifuga TaxID=98765 RepID=A0A2R6NVF4_9APHY|nr:hypothetical protein PHLCEN_2v7753 [Hermanssonia centrifuga]
MVAHRGFSAWITCGEKRLQEYEVVVDTKTNKVSCWIPCAVGQKFSVHWEDEGTGIDSAGFIILDGFTVPGQFLFGEGETERSSVRVADNAERPFVFAKVQPGQGPATALSNMKEAGMITLKIKQIKRTSLDHNPNTPRRPPPPIQGRRNIAQACVGYGAKRDTEAQHPKTWSCEPYDKANPGSLVYFTFRYRTRNWLIDQGIMPAEDYEDEPVYYEDVPAREDVSAHTPGSIGSHPDTPPSTPSSTMSKLHTPSSTTSALGSAGNPLPISRQPSRQSVRSVRSQATTSNLGDRGSSSSPTSNQGHDASEGTSKRTTRSRAARPSPYYRSYSNGGGGASGSASTPELVDATAGAPADPRRPYYRSATSTPANPTKPLPKIKIPVDSHISNSAKTYFYHHKFDNDNNDT